MAKRQKIKETPSSPPSDLATTNAPPQSPGPQKRIYEAGKHVFIFLVALVIVASRRLDALLSPQFWGEDGMMWYARAYQFGLHCLLIPQGGYLHVFTSLVALVTLLFPLSLAPLIMNLCAITLQILPVNLFLSSRFSQITVGLRLLASFVYLALPNCHEIHANLTAAQWHLALLACLLLLAQPATSRGWRIFEGIVLVLISLDAAIVFVLVPLAATLWWKRRQVWDRTSLALLVPGAVIQAVCVLLTWNSRQVAVNDANFARLVTILGRQVFLPSLFGLGPGSQPSVAGPLTFVEAIAAAVGMAVMLYVLFRGPFELKLFVLFAFALFALCLARPLAGTPERAQWDWLSVPGTGNRYYFFPMLAFLASLLWIAARANAPVILSSSAAVLLLLLTIGICRDWRYPPFVNYGFQDYATAFERAPSGTKITIPINPDWKMELTKH